MLTHKTLKFEWVVQETATLVEKAHLRQRHRVYSEPCEGWKLSASAQEGKTQVGIFLTPVDLKKETRVAYEFKVTPASNEEICYGVYKSAGRTFEPKSSEGFGRNFLDETALRRIGKRKLLITCKITWGDLPAAPTADPSRFFNKAEVSDVALVAADAQTPLFVHSFILQKSPHFKTLLDSEFSESISTARLPPPNTTAPETRFRGDVNEFGAFNTHLQPGDDQQPRQDVAATENDDKPSQPAKRRRLTSPLDSVKEEEPVTLREFRFIKVPDCSYATLSAYLAYLYSSELDFLPSPAFFLAEEKEPGSSTESDFSEWANKKAKSRTNPSLPHAMYRLADCYMEPTIKARAKGWILQNITVETAPFELFSRLSRDYPEFQADIVDFVLANLDEVIATPGWKRVLALLDEGKIPGGGSIMHKILSGSRKAAA